MESVFAALKETPIPTILVIAGIAFLLLSIAGQLIGHITVPPERQRLAAIMGGVLLIAGIALHVIPQVWPSASGGRNVPISRSATPPAGEQSASPSPAFPHAQPSPSMPKSTVETRTKDVGTSSVQTTIRGVVASITRFQKSGDLVTMEIMFRNTSSQDVTACTHTRSTELIDQATGESWRAALHAGRECNVLDANKSGRVWMKFDIREPEGRTFALSSPLFKETLEHLVLREPS
jgi:hypothetical protein